MIYGVVVSQINSGKVFCKSTFHETRLSHNSEMFGNFFTAMNHVFRDFFQLKNKNIDSISLGSFKIRAKALELPSNLAIIVIYDNLEEIYGDELLEILANCLLEYRIILENWDGKTLQNDEIINEALRYCIRQWINVKVLTGEYNLSTEFLFNTYLSVV
jgi:hypothetical protein